MKSWLRLFLAFGGLLPMFAQAADHLHWRCWYDQDVHVTCLLDTLPESNAAAQNTALPTNLPAIVKLLRQDPGAFRNRAVHIPLHTQPYEAEFTAALARATVCGSRRDCTVNFTLATPPAQEIVALIHKHLPTLARENPLVLAQLAED